MARASRNACRLAEIAIGLIALLAHPALARTPRLEYGAVASATWREGRPSAPTEKLYLAVTLNGQDRGLHEFRRRETALFASPLTLQAIGLAGAGVPGFALTPLDQIAGLSFAYDEPGQAIAITATPVLLAAAQTLLNATEPMVARQTSASGMVLNYDLNVGTSAQGSDLSGFVALRGFSGQSVLETTALGHWQSGRHGRTASAVRLDTSFSRVWPDKRLRLTVGDFITGSLAWSRPTRMGGIQIGTDSALQPYVSTAPLPAFVGSAVLPSQVELYIDGVKRWSGEAAPGPFAISPGPGRSEGMASAQLVVTDMLGKVSTQSYTFYETPRLLRQGLTEWSAAAGAVRLDYGQMSFSYADAPVFSASIRHGLSNRLTIEAHGEAGPAQGVAGLGATWLTGAPGVISGSYARSLGARQGHQWTLSYAWTAGRLHLSADLRRASAGFADLAAPWTGHGVLASETIMAGYSSRTLGAVSLGYLRLRQDGLPASRFGLANWSRPISQRLTINASLRQNLDQRTDRAVFLSLGLTPGANRYASLGLQDQAGQFSQTFAYQQNAPIEGGLGWRTDLSHLDGQWRGQVQANWLGDFGEAQARLDNYAGAVSGHVGLSGSVVMMDGAVMASRRIDDGFALVSTGGIADVPVLVHNVPVGRTNAKGQLLVTQLRPFEHNRIAIDASQLDAEYSMPTVIEDAVPSDRAGLRIAFPIRRLSAVTMTVTDATGKPLPAGSRVLVEGRDEAALLGFDGLLYLEDAPAGARITIEREGLVCTLRLPANLPSAARTKLGTQICEGDK